MANYLPALLVSVSTGMPDDASFQPLPSGQVDYLSHDWQEEDVWRSWRNMTKQKNEIANGVRLENASWRTWWKQRNKLKTISPETLNWLKDSDVTWLYGPLHTAVEWAPPPKQASTNSVSYGKIISSPSSSTNLSATAQAYGLDDRHRTQITKPILKHRSISEMLTSALPPSPILDAWEEEDEEEIVHDERHSVSDDNLQSHPSGATSRPPLLHTKSDSNVLQRKGSGAASGMDKYVKKPTPPRIIAQKGDGLASPGPSTSSHGSSYGRIRGVKRTSSSGALSDLPTQARTSRIHGLYPPHFDSHVSSYRNQTRSGSTDTNGSSRSRSGDATSQVSPGLSVYSADHQAAQPKKHISFNTFVEQCIAIDKPEDARRTRSGEHVGVVQEEEEDVDEYKRRAADDGYAEDEEDGLFENVPSDTESDVRDEDEDDSDEDVLEIRPAFRRSSITLRSEQRPSMRSPQEQEQESELSHRQRDDRRTRNDRPRFRRTSTSKSGSGSRSSHSSRSQHSQVSSERSERDRDSNPYGPPKEHVTIAPLAPTILKTAGSDGVIPPGSPYFGSPSPFGSPFGSGYFNSTMNDRNRNGIIPGHYGFEGEDEESMRHGCGLVYQPPQGSIYSLDVPSVGFGGGFENGVPGYSYPRTPAGGAVLPIGFVASPEMEEGAEEEAFDYFTENTNSIQLPVDGGATTSSSSLSDQSQYSQSLSPPPNPRIVELKSEGHHHPRQSSSSPPDSSLSSPMSSPDPSVAFEHTIVLPPPTLAIPVPAISPSHSRFDSIQDPQRQLSVDPSLLSPSSSLSPRGPSPSRGRTSFSQSSGSSYGSDAQGRGRSRTRGSSTSTSSCNSDVEPERGRSRSSRSSSTANSPLSGSVSPNSNSAPRLDGDSVGRNRGAASHHIGRDISDGMGVRLYRKTSEDFVLPKQLRGREGRDNSESLSPPTVNVNGVRPSARSMGSGSRYGRTGPAKATSYQSLIPPSPTISYESSSSPQREDKSRRSSSPSLSTSGSSSSSTVGHVSANGNGNGNETTPDIHMHVHVPPDIPEEEETRSRNPTPANSPVRELRIRVGDSSFAPFGAPPSTASPSPRKVSSSGHSRSTSLSTPTSAPKSTQSSPKTPKSSNSTPRGKSSPNDSSSHSRSASTSSIPSPSASQDMSPMPSPSPTPTQTTFSGMMSYLGSLWSSGGGTPV